MRIVKAGMIRYRYLAGLAWLAMVAVGPLNAQEPLLTLKGHTGAAFGAAFSPDGKLVASASEDGTVKLWEVATGKELRILRGHKGYVYTVAFSPDGKTLAAGAGKPGCADYYVSLFPFYITSHKQVPDGEIKLWEVATGEEKAVFKGGHHVVTYALEFAQDGKTLISAGLDATVRQWDVKTGKQLDSHKGLAIAGDEGRIAVALDGKVLSWGNEKGAIRVVDRTKNKEWSAVHPQQVVSLALSRDGQMLASGYTEVKLWEVAQGKELATLKGFRAGLFCLAFSPDGKILATVSGGWRGWTFYAGEIKLWDVSSRRELATFISHQESVACIAFSPDGQILASTSRDGTVALWRVPRVEQNGK